MSSVIQRTTGRAPATLEPSAWSLVLRSLVLLAGLLLIGWTLGTGLGWLLTEAITSLLTGVGAAG